MPSNDKAKSGGRVESYREIFAGDKTFSDVEASLSSIAARLIPMSMSEFVSKMRHG